MPAGLVVLAMGGSCLGLFGCRSRGVRPWVVHGVMALAMLAMMVPAIDPIGAPAWFVLLAVLAIWTAAAPREPTRLRDLLDLWAMAFLLLLMPGLHHHGDGRTALALPGASGGSDGGTAAHAGHLASAGGAPDAGTVVLLVVVLWMGAIVTLHARSDGPRTRRRSGTAGGLLSAAAMGAMTVTG